MVCVLDGGGPKDSENTLNSFLIKRNGNVLWQIGADFEDAAELLQSCHINFLTSVNNGHSHGHRTIEIHAHFINNKRPLPWILIFLKVGLKFKTSISFKCITTVCIFFVKELVELVARDVSELVADMSVGLRFFEFIFSWRVLVTLAWATRAAPLLGRPVAVRVSSTELVVTSADPEVPDNTAALAAVRDRVAFRNLGV